MTHLSRREFLERSMLASTAAMLAGGGLARAEEAPERQSRSPNERIGFACIGVKGQGGSHLKYYAGRDDVDLLYVCDVDEEIGRKRAKEAGEIQGREPKWVRDMREVFDDPAVNAISTATPNHWHALTAIRAMQAGKDVYVEKPVSHNVSEGRRMVEAARKYGRICQTGTQCRSMGGSKDAIKYVHDGQIGDVKIARGLCYKRRKSIGAKGEYQPPSSVDYNLWTGPAAMLPLARPNLHYDWHWVWNTGNGDLGNQGIHQMDVCRWGLAVDALPDEVLSYGGRLGYEDGEAGETANTQVIINKYGPRQLIFEVRGLETKPLRGANVGCIFEGTDGFVVLTSYDGGAAFDLDGNVVQKFNGGGDHHGNFLSAVRSGKKEDLAADIEQGHLSSALCHLGNISYLLGDKCSLDEAAKRLEGRDDALDTFDRFRTHLADNGLSPGSVEIGFGRTLAIDPSNETFVDDAQADKMLTREYREGFVVPAAGQV